MNSSELRFLVDVGVGKGIERYLQEEGYDAKAVRDIDPRMEDATGTEKLHVVKHIMKNYLDRIKNCFCVFQNDKLRIKRIKR
ncbi:MAG: hypothetical protein KKC73_02105 [Proteobacteria bacterium]|nr:hypothetical protein [Pseudomonadota bacterium]